MFKQIDAGKVGVKSLYGSVQTDILQSGLSLINRLWMWQNLIFKPKITPCLQFSEGAQSGDDAIRVLSNDGLEVVIDLTVLFRVSPKLLQKF
jgi:hypothetical protein